jgi:predicted methyltransferase
MKTALTIAALLAAPLPVSAAAQTAATKPATIPAPIARALADPARADQQPDDARRQAAAVLAFSGVKPGDVVVDYLPGQGYWTRIFTGVVGAKGHVYAAWPARAGTSERGKAAIAALAARNLANVTAAAQPADLPSAPVPADLFWTVQNYHDIPNNGAGEPALRAFDAAVFRLLKKGGTYVVIDHADAAGKGLANTGTTHRIDPATVRQQVEAAGFRFVGESRVLRNAEDDHAKNVFDPAIRGRTDQFVYKFRKP